MRDQGFATYSYMNQEDALENIYSFFASEFSAFGFIKRLSYIEGLEET